MIFIVLNVLNLLVQSENDLLGSSYANALVDLASDKNNLEEVHADMDALASILKVRTSSAVMRPVAAVRPLSGSSGSC